MSTDQMAQSGPTVEPGRACKGAAEASATGPAGLRLRVLINSGGGTVRRLGVERLHQRLTVAFTAHDVAAELVFVPGADLRERAVAARDAALDGKLDGVVVGGGDGTMGSVAGVLAGTGVPMGVLPVGTLNHFAKDLGVPLELELAVALIARRHVRAVDVGEINGTVFVNNSLIGVYPYMVAERERRRRLHKLGKWPAMTLAFFRMLARFPRRRLTLTAQGVTTPYRTPCLFIGVNEYDLERMKLRRTRGLDQGRLWILVAKQRDAAAFLWLACRMVFGGLSQSADFDTLRVVEAEVRTRASRVPVSHDGEVTRLRGPLHYRLRPGDLKVFAPVEEA